MLELSKLEMPAEGCRIEVIGDRMFVPDDPIIPIIEGDGVGPDVARAMQPVIDAAVHAAYGGDRKIVWLKVHAGETALSVYNSLLPEDTLKAIQYFRIAIKGPLTEPMNGEYGSLDVAMRQNLDLFACIRPVKYIVGIPSPVVAPEKMDVVIFRESVEDVYSGVEYAQGTAEAEKIISFMNDSFGVGIKGDSRIGIKSMSESATKRLVRMAIRYAIDHGRSSVTLVHKDKIMKNNEYDFRQWGYEVAKEEFAAKIVTENELSSMSSKVLPVNRIMIKDRTAEGMFQQLLTCPDEYDVIVAPSLDGDCLFKFCAAQVGGLSIVPGASLNEGIAVFEAPHGSAPEYAGRNIADPSSLILSAAMMLEYMGWNEAADLVTDALSSAILRIYDGKIIYSTSQFASVIIESLEQTHEPISYRKEHVKASVR